MIAYQQRRTYPWGEWFRRSVFTLHRGVDYQSSSASMAQQVRNRAWALGLRVSIHAQEAGEALRVELRERGKP